MVLGLKHLIHGNGPTKLHLSDTDHLISFTRVLFMENLRKGTTNFDRAVVVKIKNNSPEQGLEPWTVRLKA